VIQVGDLRQVERRERERGKLGVHREGESEMVERKFDTEVDEL
jgi:hypothetical protein